MQNSFFITLSILITSLFVHPLQSHALFNFFGSSHKPVLAVNGEVRIPMNSINDGDAHYFSYKGRNKEIRFFVVKSRDQVIRAAFDACDICFSEKKGYSQDGDHMICNNCGQKFHSTRINIIKGGCNPAPLQRTKQGNQLVIAEADILSGSRYF